MIKKGNRESLIGICSEIDEVILYGAGKRIELFERIFHDTIVLDKVSVILDSDCNKRGNKININGKKIIIKEPKEYSICQEKKYIIIITCMSFGEIVTYLQSSNMYKDIDTYIMSQIYASDEKKWMMEMYVPKDKRISKEQLIPKKIHYCWFGENPIPDKYKKWMESWHKYCPDYEIIEWNESNYDITKNKYMYQAYKQKKWAFVPDYARLDIIYSEGGIYLDTDVELVKNLDDFLYQDGYAGFESEKYVAFGLGFGARKGLPIIRELRDQYNDMEFPEANVSNNLVASPVIQTHFLVNKGLKQDGSYQTVNGLTIYPERVLCGKSMVSGKILIGDETKSVHHYDGSWLDKEHKKRIDDSIAELNHYFIL